MLEFWHKASEEVAARRFLLISKQTNKKENNRLGNRYCLMWEIGRIYSVETGISGNSKIYEIKHIVDFVFSKLKLLVGLNGSWLLYLFFYFFGFFKVTKLTTKKWKPVFKFFSCLSPPKTYLCIMNFKMHAFYILCHNYRLQILTLIKDRSGQGQRKKRRPLLARWEWLTRTPSFSHLKRNWLVVRRVLSATWEFIIGGECFFSAP